MDLTTTSNVKTLLGETTSANDALIGALVTSVSARVAALLDRHVEAIARTEVYSLRRFQRIVLLRGTPVTSVTSVKYSNDRDFTDDTALTENEQYELDTESGVLELTFTPQYERGNLQVIYTGGMATSAAAFRSAYPDISTAVDLQVAHLKQYRRSPGGEVRFEGGQITKTGGVDLLPEVREAVATHKRRGAWG